MKCSHCKLDFKKEELFEKNGNFFCCKGCESVYEILNEKGLDEFYEKLGKQTLTPVNFTSEEKNYNEFIKTNLEGFCEIYLMIHKIHCSACVWLNEKILIKEAGIMEVDINLLTHKARIVFDKDKINLEKIIHLIQSIGYDASAFDPLKNDKKSNALKREFYSKLIVAIACVMNIMWIAVAKYAGFFSGMDRDIKDILNFAEFILCSPVLFYTGSSFYRSAYYAIKNKQLNMDTLVISGATLAYIYSIWAMFSRLSEVYFDSVTMIICFVFVGKYLEILTKKRASDTIDGLNDFLGGEVLVFDGVKFISKKPQEVMIGDIIEVKTGDKILIDGSCIEGEASFDKSSLSGESEPVLIKRGDEVVSASILLDGMIKYVAKKTYEDSKLNKIISLLELASSKKAKIESLVNSISAYFSRTILTLSLICFLFWFFYQKVGFENALINAIAVLIIACPCALALATPVCNLIALFKALKFKVLFKSASVIEDLSKCDMVVFDKTGVLTKSQFEISKIILDENLDKKELLAFVRLSKHPICHSVMCYLEQEKIKDKKMDFKNIKNIQAKGLSANCENEEFLGGNLKFMKENGIECEELLNSHFYFAKNKKILALFEFKAILREGAKETIEYLNHKKINLMILSGDNEYAVKKVADELKIQNYKANCLPETKMQEVEKLSLNHKVLFVGDGVNDALALKFAAVSASLKEGSDLAIESSDILLLDNNLKALQESVRLSKKTFRIIKENLIFSLFYNALTIPLAFFGLINPLIAALSMSFSSIIVILNALRINK
ncbi:heavy metal translocating P-type ATPase [Campylobacter sp. US33a]|uniref:heavy metal translocating P-type ATPase n=1 Tax=Campylobacter sp. US33a TaxID=2498120 RepID=UPI0010684274|nr:heavy metal translocating P-type ATPase [Campylobacter sp. US33a]TEY03457.1 heavy metal translocating P-type ATPase [Campylobacter sp. US33a]